MVAAAALVSAPLSHAAPGLLVQAPAKQTISNHDKVNALIDQAVKLRSEGNYAAAAAMWQEILGLIEKAVGPEHPDFAKSLSNLAELLSIQVQYAAAESLSSFTSNS